MLSLLNIRCCIIDKLLALECRADECTFKIKVHVSIMLVVAISTPIIH